VRQASICRLSALGDAQEFGSVMGTMHKIIIRGFEQVTLCDDVTGEYGMGCECFSSTLDCLVYLN
jgi:hypothetical protein